MLNLRDGLKEAFYKQNAPNYLHSKRSTYPVCFYRSTVQLLLYIFFLWLATVFMMYEQKMKLQLFILSQEQETCDNVVDKNADYRRFFLTC